MYHVCEDDLHELEGERRVDERYSFDILPSENVEDSLSDLCDGRRVGREREIREV